MGSFPFNNGPGYYELTGPPASGKTITAALLATSKLWSGRAIFATTPEERGQVLSHVRGDLSIIEIQTVKEFFALVDSMESGTLLVMDSLATLRPNHPSKQEIASSVNRHWVKPRCVVLVVNHEKWPVGSGGSLWRAMRSGVFRLIKHRDRPLVSHLTPMDLFLVWEREDRPILKMLSDQEKRIWIPRVVFG